jgi:phytoene dehydrogenase-like protein
MSAIFGGKGGDRSVAEELRRLGFTTDGFIDHIARPFCGAFLLDGQLETSSRIFLFLVKMLAAGHVAFPEKGMGTLAEQLAVRLPGGGVRLRTRVEGIVQAEDRAVGVELPGGEEMQGEAVVVATDAPTAAKLTGRQIPTDPRPATCVYFASDQSLYAGPRLLLNADRDAFLNHVMQLTNVAPSYAPEGQHLLSITVLDDLGLEDAALVDRCRADLAVWFPERNLSALRHLATYRIPLAQLNQPPGIFPTLPPNTTPTQGLFLAGEYTESSTIHGAMHSGEKAAQAVLTYLAAQS